MKPSMFKSLRWRLQLWNTLVLLVVITSFGAIVHRLHWQTRLQTVDAELNRALSSVTWQLRRMLPRPRPTRRREEEQRPEGEQSSRPERNIAERQEPPRAEPNFTPPPDISVPADRILTDFSSLPEEFEQFFHAGDEEERMYFAVWDDHGELVVKSESAPELAFPSLPSNPDAPPRRMIRERAGKHLYREITLGFPMRGSRSVINIVVGRDMDHVVAEHQHSGLLLLATGFVVLAAGTIGGGWLSARAIRPIAQMTSTAESISAQNLSKRIDVNETDSELGELAVVLNSTFDRLQSAFERQQQFTADASHELRTPLSVSSTHTELALARQRSPEDYRLALQTCQHAAKRMRGLIDALLVLARLDSDAPSLKHAKLDIDPLIRDCVELVRSLAEERKITVECETSACEVLGDWNRLSQVFTNLLSNSIRYNVEGGQIHVTMKFENRSVVVRVTDTGIGIPAADLPRIFDRFYQVDKARSRADGSCGLGLSICKTIIDAHGGTIVATSEIDVGTTMEVRLPCLTEPTPVNPMKSRNEELVPNS